MSDQPITLDEAKRRFPPIWVIYDHPRDFPRHFVVRLWYGELATDQVYLRNDLDQARIAARLAGASICITRSPHDHRKIVETWL